MAVVLFCTPECSASQLKVFIRSLVAIFFKAEHGKSYLRTGYFSAVAAV